MKKSIILGVLTLLVGSALVSPYWFGNETEAKIKAEIITAQNSPSFPPWLTVQIDHYEKGWFNSTAQTTATVDFHIMLNTPATQDTTIPPLDILIKHSIKHGPFSSPQLMMAEIKSTVLIPNRGKKVFKHYFGEQSPFQQTTIFGLDGISTSTLKIPAFTGRDHTDKADVDWQGLTGNITTEWGKQAASAIINIPKFEVRNDNMTLSLSNVNLETQSRFSSERLILGNGKISIDELLASNPEGDNLQVNDIKISASMDQSGSLLNVVASVHFRKVEAPEKFSVGPGELTVEIRNLNAKAIIALQQQIQQLNKDNLSPPLRAMAIGPAFMAQGETLLKASPELEFTKLNLTTEKGDITSSLLIAFNGEGDHDIQSLPSLIPLITLDVKATAPTELLSMLAQSQIRNSITSMLEQQGQEMTPDDLERQVQEAVKQRFSEMEQMKFIVKKDSSHTAHLRFKDGKLLLNGEAADHLLKALPMPQQNRP